MVSSACCLVVLNWVFLVCCRLIGRGFNVSIIYIISKETSKGDGDGACDVTATDFYTFDTAEVFHTLTVWSIIITVIVR